jgi:hypothetical protein
MQYRSPESGDPGKQSILPIANNMMILSTSGTNYTLCMHANSIIKKNADYINIKKQSEDNHKKLPSRLSA